MTHPQPHPQPIRLALVITELAIGGAERNLVRLAQGLHGDGYEVRVYSLKARPPAPRDGLVRALEGAAIPIQYLNLSRVWQTPFAIRRLAQELRTWEPGIVQSFLFHANVVSTWACERAQTANLLWGLRVADPNRRRLWLERRLASRAQCAVCVSESVQQFAIENLGLPANKLPVIPNGLDPADYESAEAIDLSQIGLTGGRRVLLCVGRLHEQKGFDWLLSFAPDMLRRLPQHDLVIVGEGPQRQQLETLARSSGLVDRIHLVGFRSDVPRWLAAAEMLLLPSRYEGMPNVVLEAMAAGLPIVATASHGVNEALGELAESQSVKLGDSSAFQEKVISIASCLEWREKLGKANRERIQSHFTTAGMLARYRKLYSNILRKK